MINHRTQLTTREIHVVLEVLKGKTSKQIAQALFITQHTVKAHLKSIFQKTGTTNKLDFIITLFAALTRNNITTLQILQALEQLTYENANLLQKFC